MASSTASSSSASSTFCGSQSASPKLWRPRTGRLFARPRILGRRARRSPTAITLGYTLATGCIFGAFISYLGTSQQIFQEQYGTGKLFAVFFGILAAGIGLASIVNAKLVMRFGMRNLSKWALRAACILSFGFLIVAWLLGGHPPLWAFVAFMTVLFFFNGLLFGNYNALAMEPMGHIAGVAAAVIGSLSSLVAVSAGTPIGQLYDGTVVPARCRLCRHGLCRSLRHRMGGTPPCRANDNAQLSLTTALSACAARRTSCSSNR